jgi:hypothetical protein
MKFPKRRVSTMPFMNNVFTLQKSDELLVESDKWQQIMGERFVGDCGNLSQKKSYNYFKRKLFKNLSRCTSKTYPMYRS